MFYDVFSKLCAKKGISCKRAAVEIGLSNSIAAKWKRTGATPNGETLNKIAAYFDVPVGYLLGEEIEESSPVPTQSNRNFIRIAGRDGSYVEKVLTDAQMAAVKAMIEQLPDASEDI